MHSFFSGAGRTPPLRMGLVLLLAAGILWACMQVTWEHGVMPPAIAGAVAGAMLAKLAAEGVRRLHDLGLGTPAGSLVVAAFALAGIGCAAREAMAMVDGTDWAALAVLALLVALCLCPARLGGNAYGPAPSGTLAAPPPSRPSGRMALVLPLLATGAGALAAVQFFLFLEGLNEARVQQWHWALRHPPPDAGGAPAAPPQP